eukprot:2988267-Lingulodinium_polyedra.AAC.1
MQHPRTRELKASFRASLKPLQPPSLLGGYPPNSPRKSLATAVDARRSERKSSGSSPCWKWA